MAMHCHGIAHTFVVRFSYMRNAFGEILTSGCGHDPDLTYMVALCVAKIHTLSVLAHPFVCQFCYLRKAACEQLCLQDAGMAQTWLGAYGCYVCCWNIVLIKHVRNLDRCWCIHFHNNFGSMFLKSPTANESSVL